MKSADLIAFPAREAGALGEDPSRLLIYVVYDRRGEVEGYIPYALEHLRVHCRHIIVVVNGRLTSAGRVALEKVSDDIVVRDNTGFDIWGYKTGLDFVAERIQDYDEVILANDTWFGPVRPFGPMFEKMDARAAHFWGITDHVRVEPHPFTGEGYLPYHLQSYWLAVRKDMFLSPEWERYWRDLPPMDRYEDAVVKHEGVFTELFTGYGFVGEVAYPTITGRIENHAVLYAEQLLDEGCPTLKRRPFFQWPPYLDHLAVVGAWTLQAVERYGYPIELVQTDLARNVAPRVLNADAALLNVLSVSATEVGADIEAMRVVVIAHIFYPDMVSEMLNAADRLPVPYDLVVTVPDEAKASAVRDAIASRAPSCEPDIRIVSNDGRDQSAFLIGCRDVILSDRYDVLVKIHSKRTPQDASNAARRFREQQFDNLLPSSAYASNVLSMFMRERTLGIVYPPMVHIGYGTMGHAWWDNKPSFQRQCERLGIRVPIDETSPLAPYGSMYFARPDALRRLVEEEWTYAEFGSAEAYRDGGLAHVLERIPSYAAGERGYITRTIATPDYLASSHVFLDYNLDQFSSTMPETTMHQIDFLRRLGPLGRGTLEDFAHIFARLRRPQWERPLTAAFARARWVRSQLRLRRR